MRQRLVRPRRGLGLPELLVALALTAIVGTAVVKALMTQTRFADIQQKRRMARGVSRGSINFLLSELRMVENVGGVAAASAASGASSITVRVPLAMGLVCGHPGGATVISMTPADSVMVVAAALSGSAYRLNNGTYTYVEGAVSLTTAGTATCTAANITTLPGGRVVTVTPQLPPAATVGTPVFLYQRVTFAFGLSTLLPGRAALWRTLEETGSSEELIAPFDTASRVRFYRNNNDTSDVVVPPLDEITGVELVLTGTSERPRFGKSTPESAPLRTAVFFINRLN